MKTKKQLRLEAVESGELYGINNLTVLVMFVVNLVESLNEKLKDGKLNLGEYIGLLFDLKTLPDIWKYRKEIRLQIKDLSTEEAKQLILSIENEFSVPNEKAVKIVHLSLYILNDLLSIVDVIKDKE
jgi:hypothetical protein